jgi:hypothetical protein
MKYKVDTKEFFTDDGVLIKKMQCSIEVDWDKMEHGKNDLERICSHCNKAVMNIEYLKDEEVLFLMKKKPDTCLKINTTTY